MTQKLKISMLEAEIAQLKAELLTQTEIAKNNKDAYDKIRVMYDDKCHELLKLKGEHATQYEELSAVEGKLIKAQNERNHISKQFMDLCNHLEDKLKSVKIDLEVKSETVAELNAELKSIPNWIRWIFKYVF
jgi:archaellum component FlaC